MTVTYGLTSVGWVSKPLLTIQTDLQEAFKAAFGASIDVSPASIFGQLAGIFAERLSELWDGCEAVYSAFNPDAATGEALDGVSAITGTIREGATHSTVTLTLTGTAATVIPAGSQASVTGTGVKFETLADATIGGGGTITVAAQSVDTGPLVGLTGTITVIETPVSGWTAVTNAADAVPGQAVETDPALRIRRETELHTAANAALEAIRTKVLAVSGVTGCAVFENVGMTTDIDGIPAKSIWTVVSGTATAAAVRAGIFAAVGAGIDTYGTTSGTVIDSEGISHTVKYSAASEIPIHIIMAVTYDADSFPSDGATQIRDVVLAYGETLAMGKDVVARAISAKAFAIPGVLDCITHIDTAPGPTSEASIAIALAQIATFNSSHLTVNVSAGTP